jgi:hypothetical protein
LIVGRFGAVADHLAARTAPDRIWIGRRALTHNMVKIAALAG